VSCSARSRGRVAMATCDYTRAVEPNHPRRFVQLSGLGLVLALACASTLADVKPLPCSEWPTTVVAAVPLIIAALTPAQRSVVLATSRDSLLTLQGEWGEDIETLLGLNAGNAALVAAACGHDCSADQATLLLMQAAWDALKK